MVNAIIYKRGVHVGEISAEEDGQFLAECFVRQPIFDQLLDIESSKSVILGRTGSGKTAIVNEIERVKGENAIRVDPKEVAFSYVSNSSIIQFIIELGCDISILFHYLWKHIFISHAINNYFKSRNNFEQTLDRVFDAKNPARTYLLGRSEKFWIEQDIIIKEISEGFEKRVSSELGASLGEEKLAQIKSSVSEMQTISGQEKKEIQSRVKNAVDQIQIKEMNRAVEALNQLMENKQKSYYVLIDDLDLGWTDKNIQYKLIHALIDTIKSFRKLRNVKVIAAIRSDVYEKALSGYNGDGIQPEKYDSISVNVRWTRQDLLMLMDSRVSYMFKRQYTRDMVKFADIFPIKIRKSNSFDYLIERTLMRPRDLIFFVNAILDKAAGTANITSKTVHEIESEYSRKRLDALKTEWISVHPKIESYIKLLNRQTGKVNISDIVSRDALLEVCFELSELDGTDVHKDECFSHAMTYMKRENRKKLFELAACVISVLYKVGAINLKLTKNEPFINSYTNDAIVIPSQISDEAAFNVSPMLWRALGITPNL